MKQAIAMSGRQQVKTISQALVSEYVTVRMAYTGYVQVEGLCATYTPGGATDENLSELDKWMDRLDRKLATVGFRTYRNIMSRQHAPAVNGSWYRCYVVPDAAGALD
jgi:hypothetical protein